MDRRRTENRAEMKVERRRRQGRGGRWRRRRDAKGLRGEKYWGDVGVI
jgi:hypothetical protein